MNHSSAPLKICTIGGWDPCGAFGVPADIKTFSAHRCHGMAVLTVATAQNSTGWYGAEFMSADFVAQQLDAVLGDYGAVAVKTGFLGRVDLVEIVAAKLKAYRIERLVVDPVLVNAHGRPMFGPEVKAAYEQHLFPLADVITPNLKELNYLLTGETDPWSRGDAPDAALQRYRERWCRPKGLIALKGVPLPAKDGAPQQGDGWVDAQGIVIEPKPVVETVNVSGTGDTFSAALAVALAQGKSAKEGIRHASHFVQQAILAGKDWDLAQGAGPTGNFFKG